MKIVYILLILLIAGVSNCEKSPTPVDSQPQNDILIPIPADFKVDSIELICVKGSDTYNLMYNNNQIERVEITDSIEWISLVLNEESIDTLRYNGYLKGKQVIDNALVYPNPSTVSLQNHNTTSSTISTPISSATTINKYLSSSSNNLDHALSTSLNITSSDEHNTLFFDSTITISLSEGFEFKDTIVANASCQDPRYAWYRDTDTLGHDGIQIAENIDTYIVSVQDIDHYIYATAQCFNQGVDSGYTRSPYTQSIRSDFLIFEVELNQGNDVILPLWGNVDVTIDWGDGTIQKVDTEGRIRHTLYSSPSTIIISGTVDQVGRKNDTEFESSMIITKVISFGSVGLNKLNDSKYKDSYRLVHVPKELPETLTDISEMLYESQRFNQDLSSWNVSQVIDMSYLFSNAEMFNQDISNWNVSNTVYMSHMFNSAASFNQDIGNWDVSNVIDMSDMFNDATSYNQDIGNWNVSNVTNMSSMFFEATSFDQDISDWDVSNVINMQAMFGLDSSFNQPISSWNVKNVINMSSMFTKATTFNQDISNWDVSNVKTMSWMFYEATSFDQDISDWDISKVKDMREMFEGITLSTKNYSNMLLKWSQLEVQHDVNFSAGNSQYTPDAASARKKLIDEFGWDITDGGVAQ